MRTKRVFPPTDDELADRIILSVRTKGFESEIEVPVPLELGGADKFVLSWLAMMEQALKMNHATQPTEPSNG